jgi:hypothetical protein
VGRGLLRAVIVRPTISVVEQVICMPKKMDPTIVLHGFRTPSQSGCLKEKKASALSTAHHPLLLHVCMLKATSGIFLHGQSGSLHAVCKASMRACFSHHCAHE